MGHEDTALENLHELVLDIAERRGIGKILAGDAGQVLYVKRDASLRVNERRVGLDDRSSLYP